MKLILTQDVDNVGNEGDVVEVKPGFGRNFLIPQKLAVTFSKSQLKQVEEKRSHEDRKIDRQKDVLLDLLSKVADLNITVKMKSE
ncbi:MAG: 50S ribosomal protein L9, partial [Candidatus Marinimicrobia bacterium]|nr:50S ribosomal protein L9 [Candidatus Neomarinimicrobiota bacterium]